ncbi:hypothetical protein J6590_017293 [Homalodisca vitripennis]|nr:hypothetical protein J6590_017293 [Homalodisca vitripennis]
MNIIVLTIAIAAVLRGLEASNGTEELAELLAEAGENAEENLRYDLVDPLKTTVSDRRALDLTSPMAKNGATDDSMVKKFGSDYFLSEEQNFTLPESRESGVIQRVVKTSPPPATTVYPAEEESLAEKVLDSLSMPVVRPASGVEWLLDVYNPHHWQPSFLPGAPRLSKDCKNDLQIYLRALHNGTIWAAKSNFRLAAARHFRDNKLRGKCLKKAVLFHTHGFLLGYHSARTNARLRLYSRYYKREQVGWLLTGHIQSVLISLVKRAQRVILEEYNIHGYSSIHGISMDIVVSMDFSKTIVFHIEYRNSVPSSVMMHFPGIITLECVL